MTDEKTEPTINRNVPAQEGYKPRPGVPLPGGDRVHGGYQGPTNQRTTPPNPPPKKK